MAAKMKKADLEAIKQNGYVRDGFGSLGIVAGTPVLRNGVICVNCQGIHPGDVVTVADRVAQSMGRKGWNVDVWFDEEANELKISHTEEEEVPSSRSRSGGNQCAKES